MPDRNIRRFRKKPISEPIVEAEQFIENKIPWPEGVRRFGTGFHIETRDGWASISDGEWVITVVKPERYLSSDIFATHDEVPCGSP